MAGPGPPCGPAQRVYGTRVRPRNCTHDRRWGSYQSVYFGVSLTQATADGPIATALHQVLRNGGYRWAFLGHARRPVLMATGEGDGYFERSISSSSLLVVGPQASDKLYADAVKRAARKFGLQITAEKPWKFGPLGRVRADSPTTAEALVFTRGVDYDVILWPMRLATSRLSRLSDGRCAS